MYTIYSVYNMCDVLYYILLMLKSGVEINRYDLVLKALFMRLNKDSSRIQMLANNHMIYKKMKPCD